MSIRIQIHVAAAIAFSTLALNATPEAMAQSPGTGTVAETTYNLPPQPLADALKAVGAQANINVLISPELVDGKQAPALRASLTVDQAIARLLRGTGITYRYVSDKTIVLAENKPTARLSEQEIIRLAQAQSAGPAGPAGAADGAELAQEISSAATDDGQKLEEVTVTGTRQELYSSRVVTSGVLGDKDPLDIPFAVSSYTSELARMQGAYTPAQILKNDPAAQNQGEYAGYQNNVVIRGFPGGLGNVRRDGLIAESESDYPIEAYDRVELIKGVAGFLYGFSEPGGITNYVTKRPTRAAFADLDVRFQDGTGPYVHLDTGGPIGEGRYGYRANLVYQDSDGFEHPVDLRRFVAALAFDAKVSDALLVRFDGTYSTREQPGGLGLPLTTDGREPPRYNPDHLLVPSWNRFKWGSAHVGLRADYTISDDWQLQAQVNRDRLRNRLRFSIITSLEPDGDFEELAINVNPASDNRTDNATGQLIALGKVRTGPIAHELAFGAFHRRMDYEFLSAPGDNAALVTGNIHDVVFPDRPVIDGGPLEVADAIDLRETHLFAADTLHFGEQWQLMLGARWVHADATLDVWETSGKTSPSAAVLFKPSTATTLYASYARSLQYSTKGPEVNGSGDPVVNPNALLAPNQAKQYELGGKARLGAGLDVGLALYRIELPSDYLDEATNVYGRFGEQVNRGFELTMAGNVRSNLAIIAGLGYLDAKITSAADPAIEGNRPAANARITGNLFVNYGVTAVPGLSLNAGVYRTGSRYLDLQNEVSVKGYTRTDVGAQYHFDAFAKDLTLRLNVNNVFGKFYWEGLGPFYHSYTAGQDRTYIVSAQMQLF